MWLQASMRSHTRSTKLMAIGVLDRIHERMIATSTDREGSHQSQLARTSSPTATADILPVMKARRRSIWSWVGLLLLIAAIAGILAYILHAHDLKSAGTLVQTLAALVAIVGTLVTIVCTVAARLETRRRSVHDSRSQLERVADELAEQVRRQWDRAAGERRLMYPAPIPIRWQWSRRPVAGPVTEAAGGDVGTRFAPLTGMAPITAERLRYGTLKDLFGVYGGLDSGRLIILGRPGTGKTSAAIRLLLDALRHRAVLGTAEERARVPVPVLFTLRGWDPNKKSFADWLADRLECDYEFLTAREYGPDAATRLINGNYLAVILDGLDEIPKKLRPAVLRALDEQVTFRLVVLTRSDELVTAVSGDRLVSGDHLVGAAALELCPVDPRQAAEYLASCQIDSPSPAWRRVVEHLREYPGRILAQALDTPLMVTLVRDTYRHDDPVDELIGSSRFASRESIEDHLLDRILPIAYAQYPGRSAPPCTVDEARKGLRFLARRMHDEGTRDLAWWQISRWVPAWPRALATALLVGLWGILVFGLPGVLGRGLKDGLLYGLAAGLTFALVFGLASVICNRYSRQPGWLPWIRPDIRPLLLFGLMGGLVFGFANGLAVGLAYGSTAGLAVGFLGGIITTALALWIVFRILTRLAEPSVEAANSIDPRVLWRRERQRGLKAGLVFGIAAGIVHGLKHLLVYEFVFKVVLRLSLELSLVALFVGTLTNALTIGLGVVLVSSTTWMTTLASAQLWRRGQTPVRLLSFLEDAHKREVLRCVGPKYQFRHARLQARLAGMRE